jgi:hypothetical protein
MAKRKSSPQSKATNAIYSNLAVIVAVVLVAMSSLALWANNFTGNMVKTELAAQKIYFPEKGTPALDPQKFPDLQKYAGQLVDTPDEAKAYANGYIGRHLEDVAGGKVYSEVSAEARKDPKNEKLQQQKANLFQGETLRGILLGTGYGFGTLGKIAGVAAYVLFAGAVALLGAAFVLRTRI